MAISRIRGEQIRQGVLVNQHIAENAAIEESKLNVNWSSHYQQALETKKVVDFVQVGNKAVGDASEFNLTVNGVLDGGLATTTSGSTLEGIITDAPYNQVIIRDAVSGDPIVDVATEFEVYGRLVHDGVDFKVMFFTEDGVTETAFTMPTGTEIDFQYMERFNLKTVSELFAANEKFVAGSADITAYQNIHQLASDIYGAGYSLDRDGEGNLTVSLSEQISTEVAERKAEMAQLKADLVAAGEAGKGANLIGIEDLANVFTSVTVEGALGELEGRLQSVEQSGGVEVTEARDSSLTGAHASLDARIEADVAEVLARLTTEKQRAEAAEAQLATDLAAEVSRATAEEARIDAKLDQEITDRTADVAAEETRAIAEEARIEGKVDAAQAEIDEAKASTVKSADGGVTPKVFLSVDARLEESEADHKSLSDAVDAKDAANETRFSAVEAKDVEQDGRLDAVEAKNVAQDGRLDVNEAKNVEQDGRLDAVELEVETARGSESSLDVRLDRALNENGTLKAGSQIHDHFRARFQAAGGETQVTLAQFNKVGLPNFQVGDDSLEVFINGQLQEPGMNYQEGANGDVIIFDLSDGTVLEPTDIIQIKYFVNNAE